MMRVLAQAFACSNLCLPHCRWTPYGEPGYRDDTRAYDRRSRGGRGDGYPGEGIDFYNGGSRFSRGRGRGWGGAAVMPLWKKWKHDLYSTQEEEQQQQEGDDGRQKVEQEQEEQEDGLNEGPLVAALGEEMQA